MKCRCKRTYDSIKDVFIQGEIYDVIPGKTRIMGYDTYKVTGVELQNNVVQYLTFLDWRFFQYFDLIDDEIWEDISDELKFNDEV